MSTPRFLKCRCQHCQGSIEFPAEGAGTIAACPHCRAGTTLGFNDSTAADLATARTRAWAIGGVIVLVMLLIAALVAVHLLRDLAPRVRRARAQNAPQPAAPASVAPAAAAHPPVAMSGEAEPEPVLTDELSISPVGFVTQPGSALRHATGTVVNISGHKRIGLTIELQLFDANGRGLQQLRTTRPVLEPSARWDFRVPVLDPKSSFARVTAVREER